MRGLSAFITLMFAASLVHAADRYYLKNTIQNYFSNTRHVVKNPNYKTRARDFIFNEFKRFGLETEFHEFTHIGTDNRFHFYHNIIGVLKGSNFGKQNDRIIGLAAHYDTVNETVGVDDNGAGVAALLAAANALTQKNKRGATRQHTIIFVSFDLEELGYFGSKAFVELWVPKWLQQNYPNDIAAAHGVFVLDSVMNFDQSANSQSVPNLEQMRYVFHSAIENITNHNFAGDFIATVYRSDTDDHRLASAFREQWTKVNTPYEIQFFGLPAGWQHRLESFSDFLRSDHQNFWFSGLRLPAIFLTDTANLRGSMANCYHQACDNVTVMLTDNNIGFLAKTTDTLVATINVLSEVKEPISRAGALRGERGVVFLPLILSFILFQM